MYICLYGIAKQWDEIYGKFLSSLYHNQKMLQLNKYFRKTDLDNEGDDIIAEENCE